MQTWITITDIVGSLVALTAAVVNLITAGRNRRR